MNRRVIFSVFGSLIFINLALESNLVEESFSHEENALPSSFEKGSDLPYGGDLYINGESFREYADYIVDETEISFFPEFVFPGSTIFVKTDCLELFFTHLHPRIISPYILITHNSDFPAPGPYSSMLDDNKLIAWFAQNVEDVTHNKLHPIPIGIANSCWGHGSKEVFSFAKQKFAKIQRNLPLYMNFTVDIARQSRTAIYNTFSNKSFCHISQPKGFLYYLKDLAASRFVLSPRGNGLDTHRTWESLYMGAIPIVQRSYMDAAFEGLPVLIVDNWDEITEEFLENKYLEMQTRSYQLEKLHAKYWFRLIDSYKESYRSADANSLTKREEQLIQHVEWSIAQAKKEKSNLSSSAMEIPGWISPKTRHLLNNLCSLQNVTYFDVGSIHGASWIAALFNNESNLASAVAIDNWNDSTRHNRLVYQYTIRFLCKAPCEIFSGDTCSLDIGSSFKYPVNVVFYDGDPSSQAVENALTYYHPVFDDSFILIVDDWNWDTVRAGTVSALNKLDYQVLFAKYLPARGNGDIQYWWNGVYIAVIRKTHRN